MLLSAIVQYIVLFAEAFNRTENIEHETIKNTNSTSQNYAVDKGAINNEITKRKEPVKLNMKQRFIMNQVLSVYAIEDVENKLCLNHSSEFKIALRAFEPWALKMIDSSSKIQSGILLGNLVEFGSFKQCIQIKAETISGTIKGKHCTLKITPPMKIMKKILSFRGISEKRFENNIKPIVEDAGIYWSVCVPDSCSYDDALKHFTKNIESISEGLHVDVEASEFSCYTLEDEPVLGVKEYIVIGILLGFVIISFLCGLIDMYIKGRDTEKPIFVDIFSFYNNAKYIFAYSKHDPLGLKCLDGIRFLSNSYVVMGHSFMMMLFAPSVNSLELMEWVLDYSSTIIIGGTVSVDSFFLLSGFLVTYHTLDILTLTNGKFNWSFFYLARFIRLTPSYAVAILIFATLLQFCGSGPFWRQSIWGLQKPCQDMWWSALINLQNYINPKHVCVIQTWYLTNDFLYYIFSPLLIYPLWRWKVVGWVILFLFYILSVLMNFYLAWKHKYGAGMLITRQLLQTDYFAHHYIAPHVRASTYILGVALGGILHRTKNRKVDLHPVTVTVGWMWSLALMGTTILGNHIFQLEDHEYDRLETSFYLSMSRSSWAVGLMWVIWACKYGYGGPINYFLSHPVFHILSKLTYSIFLWHLPMQFMMVGALKQPIYFADFNMVYRFLGEFCMIITFSLFYTIIYECPWVRVIKHLKGKTPKVTDKN